MAGVSGDLRALANRDGFDAVFAGFCAGASGDVRIN